jgi:Domain of unknown function (DUF6702)
LFPKTFLMLLKIKNKAAVVLLLALFISSGWLLHKFYVSLTEIRYNPETERIEVSMRIFPDDLDLALMERTGIRTLLGTELESPQADSLLMIYIQQEFELHVNGEEIVLNYLGKEPESDAIWCYLESSKVPPPVTISIRNAILTEYFPDQVNIIQVYDGKWNRGMLLNRSENTGKLTIGE